MTMYEGQTLTTEETLIIHQCCSCQCFFAISSRLDERARATGIEFYCPSGHSQVYRKSENTKLKEDVQRLEREKMNLSNIVEQKNHAITQLGYSVRAQKAAKTKIMNRVKNGVCPCCNRTFTNLQGHFKSKHPELLTP